GVRYGAAVFIFPIGDAPNPQGYRPWVTWLLIAANVLVYVVFTLPQSYELLAPTDPAFQDYLELVRQLVPEGTDLSMLTVTRWDLSVYEYGFRPSAPNLFDLFSSMFMHAGLAHLGGNMLFLWIYGDNVEHRLGRTWFLLAYLATGVLATLAFAAWEGFASSVPLVGASGAISGVLGLYFVSFPRNVVKMFVLLLPFFVNTVVLPAWVVLGVYVLFDNLVPLLFAGSATGVAYGAHLGGFVAGMGVAWAVSARGISMPTSAPRGQTGQVVELPRSGDDSLEGIVADADRLIAAGRPRSGLTMLVRRHDRSDPGERGQLALAIGQRLLRLGRVTEAYQWLVQALRNPASRAAAASELQQLDLPPQLLTRLGLTPRG
ncbi:MAG: rhomboid family intramembrane serine protease, partial [Myxococcota bacterium]